MAGQANYYDILGVAPTSEQIVIQAAYRALMRRYHPDTDRSSGAAARAQKIIEAYETLSDPSRRAAYDRTQSRSFDRDKAGTSAPPGSEQPRKQAPPPQRRVDDGSSSNRRGLTAAAIYIALVSASGAIWYATQSSSGSRSDAIATEDTSSSGGIDQSTEDYSDLSASYVEQSANMGIAVTPEDEVQAKPLSAQSPEPVDYEHIEEAAVKFATILMRDGIAGARDYSQKCHAEVIRDPTWAKADYCAAFDYAARNVDSAIASQLGVSENGYFKFQNENQADRYVAAGAPSYAVMTRLRQIEEPAAAAGREATSSAIARWRARQKPQEQEQAVENVETSPGATASVVEPTE